MSELVNKFRSDIEMFLGKTGISKTRMGKESINDPHAVFDWLEGRGNPRVLTMQKIYDYMNSHTTITVIGYEHQIPEMTGVSL